MLGDLRQQLVNRKPGLGRDLLDEIASENAMQGIRRYRLVLSVPDPGRNHVSEPSRLEFLNQTAEPPLLRSERRHQRFRDAGCGSVAPAEQRSDRVKQTHPGLLNESHISASFDRGVTESAMYSGGFS